MCTFIWLIVGITMLTITIFVHRHSYERTYRDEIGDKLPFPLWLLALMIVVAMVPILNIIAFIVGVVTYAMNYNEYEGVLFHCESRWWSNLMEFLNKQV